jgi:hypothetical protein
MYKKPNIKRLSIDNAYPDLQVVDGVYKGPKVFEGDLHLGYTRIKNLGDLEHVTGYLNFWSSQVSSIGKVKYVDGFLLLDNTKIKSLGNLERVNDGIHLYGEAYSLEEFAITINKFKSNTSLEDYPLHLNHDNIIVRNIVKDYLESGELASL